MRRNRRNNAKKERIIMIASSAFVLAALTMTGIYMKSNQVEAPDDGYTIDFTALENNTQDKLQEIVQNNQTEDNQENNISNSIPQKSVNANGNNSFADDVLNMEEDLDYTPMEVGSGQVDLPGLSQKESIQDEINNQGDVNIQDEANIQNELNMQEGINLPDGTEAELEPEFLPKSQEQQETGTSNAIVAGNLHFAEEHGLVRPVSSDTVMIPFNMDNTVYFYTLKNYKCNPALVMKAEEGAAVTACAEGRVIDIFDHEEIGHAITMDIGDGYEITYGQLEDVNVTLNSYVQAGEIIGTVAKPTMYYCVEGSNLYLKLTANGTPVNPEPLFR